MLPAVILSAKVTIDGLNKANSELSVYNKQWEKVAGTAEAAGVSIDNTHKKIDELRAATSVPIVQEIRIEVNDDAVRAYSGSAGAAAASRAGGSTGSDAGFSAVMLTKNMTQIRQWDRGHPNFFASGGTTGASSADIQKLIQMLQVGRSGGGRAGSSDNSGWGVDAAQLFTGHSGGGSHGRLPAPWWARLAMGGGRLPGAGSLGSFAGFGAEHFVLSAGGVLGSGVAAAAGGGLLAAGAAGKIAIGGGSDALVGAATIAGTKEITEAQTKWNEAIKQYGYYSTQARTAQKGFNEAMREAGPAGEAELKLGEHAKHLEKIFKLETAGARKKSAHLDNQGLNVAEAFVPKIAGAAADNLTIINKDIKPLFAWLKGPEGMGVFDTLENKFKSDLPTSIHAFTQAIEFILKTVADASKFTGGFTESLDKFFTKWNEPQNFSIWEEHIENLIEDFHMWMGFLKDVGHLLADIFSNDAHTGSAIVIALDEMINKADEWVNSTEGTHELTNIFAIHKEEILALLAIIPPLVTIFRQVYMEVAPPLVHAATAVMIVIANLLEKFEQTGPIAKWALGIALITWKMGLLKPALGWLWQQIGMFPAKMSAIEASNAAVVDSNSALIASNEALATSYAEVAAASDTAAGVNATTGEILQKHPNQMAMDISEAATAEGSQLSLFAQTPANSITKDAATVERQGSSLAGSLMSGVSKAIPVAAATYGVLNILTSVFSKGKNHLKDAGFEAGGAIVGGVAGFMLGGPMGAALGVGLGSLGGELLSKMFNSSPKHPLAERLNTELKAAHSVGSEAKSAFAGIEQAEKNLTHERNGSKKTTNEVHDAEKHLNEVVKKYGPISKEAHQAEEELSEVRKVNQEATETWTSAQELSNLQKHEAILLAREAVPNDKVSLENLQDRIKHLKAVYEEEGHNLTSTRNLNKAIKEKVEIQKELHETYAQLNQLSPKAVEELKHLTDGQLKYGKNYLSLIPDFKSFETASIAAMSKAELAAMHAQGHFTNFSSTLSTSMEASGTSIKNMSELGITSIGQLMGTMNESLQELGISPVKFHGKTNKLAQHQGHTGKGHQAGGIVVPGSGSGDTVPLTAMVEPGEMVHVLNRNATKKLSQLESLNKAVPRSQSGGTLNGEAITAATQEAEKLHGVPYVWGGGHQGFTAQAGLDCSGAVSLDLHVAGLLEGSPLTSSGFETWGAPGPGAITVYANPSHAWMEINGRPWGTWVEGGKSELGWQPHPPKSFVDEYVARHPSGMAGSVLGPSGLAKIEKLIAPKLSGPSGKLKELGQGVLNTVTTGANTYIQKHAPAGGLPGGGGNADISLKGLGNERFAVAAEEVKRAHANRLATLALFAALIDEGGPDSNVLEGEGAGVGAPIMPMAQEISGFLTGHPTWTGNGSAIELSHQNLPYWEIDQIIQASGAGAASNGKDNYGTHGGEAEAIMSKFGLQKGGTVAHPLRVIEGIVKGEGAKKSGPVVKAGNKIKPVLRTIEGFGIKGSKLERLAGLTTKEEIYGEYATEAEQLDQTVSAPAKEIEKLEKEGKSTEHLVQGKFNGFTDGVWLNKKLGVLETLRKELNLDESWVGGEKSRVLHILKGSKGQFNEVTKNIRHAEKHKREVEAKIREIQEQIKQYEKEIREIEHHQSSNTNQMNKELKELEHQLSKAEGAPKQTAAVHEEIESLRGQIHSKKQAIAATGGATHGSVKSLHEKITEDNKRVTGETKAIKDIEKDVTRFQRQEGALNEIIPVLESQREAVDSTLSGILSSGGQVGSKSFVGLATVQGIGGKGGGEIFAVERQLEAINENLHPHVEPVVESEQEAKEKPLREIESRLALAGLTPGKEDDIAALNEEKIYDQGRLNEALASNNIEEITQWAEALKGTEEQISGESGGSQAAEEKLAVQEALNEELRKNLATLQAESPVMASMRSVSSIANAGAFAMGGMVAATVGENGAETVLLPNGSNVVSNAERRSVVAASSRPGVNFEKIEFHEAEGRVSGLANGQRFDTEAEITKVTRKQATTAVRSRTPGGATR